MNLGDIRTIASAKLRLDNDVQGEQSLIDIWANEAVRDILQKTRITVRHQSMDMTAGQEDYELDTDIMSIISIRNAGTIPSRMQRVTLTELEDFRIASSVGSTPAQFYAIEGSDFLSVYPPPGSNETLHIMYVPLPTEMSDAAHDPSATAYGGIPLWAHKAIEFYVLREGADYDNHAPSKAGEQFNVRYVEMLSWIMKMIRQQGGSILPVAKQSRIRAGTIPPHDPSTDIW